MKILWSFFSAFCFLLEAGYSGSPNKGKTSTKAMSFRAEPHGMNCAKRKTITGRSLRAEWNTLPTCLPIPAWAGKIGISLKTTCFHRTTNGLPQKGANWLALSVASWRVRVIERLFFHIFPVSWMVFAEFALGIDDTPRVQKWSKKKYRTKEYNQVQVSSTSTHLNSHICFELSLLLDVFPPRSTKVQWCRVPGRSQG